MAPPLSKTGMDLLNRRDFLQHARTGLAGIALMSLLADRSKAATPIRPQIDPEHPLRSRPPHFEPRAKRVLVIFCSGAVSHVDSWDWKPGLVRMDGKPLPGSSDQIVTFQGENGNLVKPLYEFKPRGQSGKMISDLFPNVAELADDLCFIHSMTAKSNTHGPAENQMSTGFIFDGFPSVGAWVSYALGSETEDLPAFVAIPDPRGVPQAAVNNWTNGFLPAVFQGTAFNSDQADHESRHTRRIHGLPGSDSAGSPQISQRQTPRTLPRRFRAGRADRQLRAGCQDAALRARSRRPLAESASTLKEYGADDPDPIRSGFAKNCILARRLLERDVRCVQLYNGAYAMGEGVGNWDGHRKLKEQYDIHGPFSINPPPR